MNFVDAAIALLEEQKAPLPVEVLCQLALDRGLIDKPGASPLRSMKGRLTTEANRGADSRVVRLEGDRWWLAGAEAAVDAADTEEAEAEEAQAAEAQAERAATPAAVAVDARAAAAAGQIADDRLADDRLADDRLVDDDLAADDLAADDLVDDDLVDDDDLDDDFDDDEVAGASDDDDVAGADHDHDHDHDDDDHGDRVAGDDDVGAPRGAGGGAAADEARADRGDHAGEAAASDADDADDDDDDHDEDEDDAEGDEPPRSLTAEEVELEKVYGDESRATTPVGDLAEYRDSQTADEDRPMRPEILPDRGRGQGDRGRDRFRGRREGRRGERRPEDGRAADGDRAQGTAARAPLEVREPRPAEEPEDRPGAAAEPATPAGLAERATMVLAAIKGGQPVPVRQLAQMMRKRRLVEDDPEKVWRPLKGALLHEQQRRQASGLSPRVEYRGRDLFAYCGPGGGLEAAENQLEAAMATVAAATQSALVSRLGELELGALEQLAHLYLTAAGYHGIDWLKRVERSSYAVAREPGSSEAIMVGVRTGNQPVDRRGVGELRAGVQAKNAARGLLLAPRELGDEADAERARPGKPIAVLCGTAFASALIRAGVGVQVRSVPIGFLDGDLFDRLGDM